MNLKKLSNVSLIMIFTLVVIDIFFGKNIDREYRIILTILLAISLVLSVAIEIFQIIKKRMK